MTKQNYDIKNEKILEEITNLKRKNPGLFKRRLDLSWSNWGFGVEDLEASAKRLADAGIDYIELHGNHYGDDLGYEVNETLKVLGDHGLQVSGICGMFSAGNDLSSNDPRQRQAAIDYLKREVSFAEAVKARYILVVPGAVGRPEAYDDMEFDRSAATLRTIARLFVEHDVRAAIEPIRSAEVSIVHTVADAIRYIDTVNHPGVRHINGDVYHMQTEESHIGEAILQAGDRLLNLHLADSNRCALGEGFLDLDTIIRALYLNSYNDEGKFVTPEPLGPGGNPYPAMYGRPDAKQLDRMVEQSVRYFREREEVVLSI